MRAQEWQRLVGGNVRRVRQAKALTQEEIAARSEIDVTYLRGIEAGRRNPSLLVMVRIARALSIQPTDLFESN